MTDKFGVFAKAVRATDRKHPGWSEIHIVRQRDRPEGGIDLRIMGGTNEQPSHSPSE